MRRNRLEPPRISAGTFRFFSAYTHWYVGRNLHSVRLLRNGFDPTSLHGPVIICLNHPGWWDPLIALVLAQNLLPERSHYAPIEAKALTRYRIFERIGFFGVEPGTAAGAVRFLRMGEAILQQPNAALWVTGQGEFVDVRARPVVLRNGISHLAALVPNALVVPLAVEYTFWEERCPEALCAFGAPVVFGSDDMRHGGTAKVAQALTAVMDDLARAACARDRDRFALLLRGNAGVGGMYDAWRRLASRLRGERFRREHGLEV